MFHAILEVANKFWINTDNDEIYNLQDFITYQIPVIRIWNFAQLLIYHTSLTVYLSFSAFNKYFMLSRHFQDRLTGCHSHLLLLKNFFSRFIVISIPEWFTDECGKMSSKHLVLFTLSPAYNLSFHNTYFVNSDY